jgi:hypothetical protein
MNWLMRHDLSFLHEHKVVGLSSGRVSQVWRAHSDMANILAVLLILRTAAAMLNIVSDNGIDAPVLRALQVLAGTAATACASSVCCFNDGASRATMERTNSG